MQHNSNIAMNIKHLAFSRSTHCRRICQPVIESLSSMQHKRPNQSFSEDAASARPRPRRRFGFLVSHFTRPPRQRRLTPLVRLLVSIILRYYRTTQQPFGGFFEQIHCFFNLYRLHVADCGRQDPGVSVNLILSPFRISGPNTEKEKEVFSSWIKNVAYGISRRGDASIEPSSIRLFQHRFLKKFESTSSHWRLSYIIWLSIVMHKQH